jgi:hypothetical protein
MKNNFEFNRLYINQNLFIMYKKNGKNLINSRISFYKNLYYLDSFLF